MVPTPARALHLGLVLALFGGCYPGGGDGTAPALRELYFPVGMAVSRGGNVLYVANADFDLQYNGGTVQSYDLFRIRQDALRIMQDPTDPAVPIANRAGLDPGACPAAAPALRSGSRKALGETCAPPVTSSNYVRDAAVIGAFATDLQLSSCIERCTADVRVCAPGDTACETTREICARQKADCKDLRGRRLYIPIRGDASVTWASLTPDSPDDVPPEASGDYAPWRLDCGERTEGRCAESHHTGNSPSEPGNTRGLTMPGEPFGLAQSEDGATMIVTHQTDTKTSLLTTGLSVSALREARGGSPLPSPTLQFVLDGVKVGGNGAAAIPHDPEAFPCVDGTSCELPKPAFLQTSRAAAELELLRVYPDEGASGTPSSLLRPFLLRERTFALTANAVGIDSRGVAIDASPRTSCKLRARNEEERVQCARRPARLFFANRSPDSLLVGEVGESPGSLEGGYDPDRVTVHGNVPLALGPNVSLRSGPSKVYLAPIVDRDGRYSLRVFVACFDAGVVYIYDPDAGVVENVIRVGPGPFAMAFDPFDPDDLATRPLVPEDPRIPGLRRYRFAYVASFTRSYVQLIDLDNARTDKSTYQTVVFTLGVPTTPKGAR